MAVQLNFGTKRYLYRKGMIACYFLRSEVDASANVLVLSSFLLVISLDNIIPFLLWFSNSAGTGDSTGNIFLITQRGIDVH